jgi:GT2 family glycosyltransferase
MTNFRDDHGRLEAVIVVHYGDNDSLEENCRSWEAEVPAGVSLYVVDNNPFTSREESSNLFPSFDKWIYLSRPSNPGYLGGVEAAVISLGSSGAELRSTDFIIVTNSDVENMSDPTMFLGRVTEDPSIAVVGPELNPPPSWMPRDLSLMKSLLGGALWVCRSFLPISLLNSKVDAARSGAYHDPPSPTPPDQLMVHGACFAVRIDVLQRYFAFRHRPWMYGEEVLLGRVLRRMGLTFVVDENWHVSHPSKTFSRHVSRRLARARARALWAITLDRSFELIQKSRNFRFRSFPHSSKERAN